jgi:hypothetical protein
VRGNWPSISRLHPQAQLQAESTYRLRVPDKVPAEQFWAVTLTTMRPAVSSAARTAWASIPTTRRCTATTTVRWTFTSDRSNPPARMPTGSHHARPRLFPVIPASKGRPRALRLIHAEACGAAVAVRSGRCPVRAQGSKVRFADDPPATRPRLSVQGSMSASA